MNCLTNDVVIYSIHIDAKDLFECELKHFRSLDALVEFCKSFEDKECTRDEILIRKRTYYDYNAFKYFKACDHFMFYDKKSQKIKDQNMRFFFTSEDL